MMPPQVARIPATMTTKAKTPKSKSKGPSTPAAISSAASSPSKKNGEEHGAHGGKLKHKRRYCRIEGCERIVKSQGLCQRHGAKPRLCKVQGCEKQAQGNFDGMCKSHFKEHKRKTTPMPPAEPPQASMVPTPEGFSVFDNVLPASVDFFPTHAPVMAQMPLVKHLREGFEGGKPPAWHRNEERKARGLLPIHNPATQLEGWERELVWMEILVLTGVPEVSFRHLARAWGRDKGFHMVLAQFICERHGDVERKKRKRDAEEEAAAQAAAAAASKKAKKVPYRKHVPVDVRELRAAMLSPEKKKQLQALLRRRSIENKKAGEGEDDDEMLIGADVWDDTCYGDANYNEALAADLFNLTPEESIVLMKRLSSKSQPRAAHKNPHDCDDDSNSTFTKPVSQGRGTAVTAKDGEDAGQHSSQKAPQHQSTSDVPPSVVAVRDSPPSDNEESLGPAFASGSLKPNEEHVKTQHQNSQIVGQQQHFESTDQQQQQYPQQQEQNHPSFDFLNAQLQNQSSGVEHEFQQPQPRQQHQQSQEYQQQGQEYQPTQQGQEVQQPLIQNGSSSNMQQKEDYQPGHDFQPSQQGHEFQQPQVQQHSSNGLRQTEGHQQNALQTQLQGQGFDGTQHSHEYQRSQHGQDFHQAQLHHQNSSTLQPHGQFQPPQTHLQNHPSTGSATSTQLSHNYQQPEQQVQHQEHNSGSLQQQNDQFQHHLQQQAQQYDNPVSIQEQSQEYPQLQAQNSGSFPPSTNQIFEQHHTIDQGHQLPPQLHAQSSSTSQQQQEQQRFSHDFPPQQHYQNTGQLNNHSIQHQYDQQGAQAQVLHQRHPSQHAQDMQVVTQSFHQRHPSQHNSEIQHIGHAPAPSLYEFPPIQQGQLMPSIGQTQPPPLHQRHPSLHAQDMQHLGHSQVQQFDHSLQQDVDSCHPQALHQRQHSQAGVHLHLLGHSNQPVKGFGQHQQQGLEHPQNLHQRQHSQSHFIQEQGHSPQLSGQPVQQHLQFHDFNQAQAQQTQSFHRSHSTPGQSSDPLRQQGQHYARQSVASQHHVNTQPFYQHHNKDHDSHIQAQEQEINGEPSLHHYDHENEHMSAVEDDHEEKDNDESHRHHDHVGVEEEVHYHDSDDHQSNSSGGIGQSKEVQYMQFSQQQNPQGASSAHQHGSTHNSPQFAPANAPYAPSQSPAQIHVASYQTADGQSHAGYAQTPSPSGALYPPVNASESHAPGYHNIEGQSHSTYAPAPANDPYVPEKVSTAQPAPAMHPFEGEALFELPYTTAGAVTLNEQQQDVQNQHTHWATAETPALSQDGNLHQQWTTMDTRGQQQQQWHSTEPSQNPSQEQHQWASTPTSQNESQAQQQWSNAPSSSQNANQEEQQWTSTEPSKSASQGQPAENWGNIKSESAAQDQLSWGDQAVYSASRSESQVQDGGDYKCTQEHHVVAVEKDQA